MAEARLRTCSSFRELEEESVPVGRLHSVPEASENGDQQGNKEWKIRGRGRRPNTKTTEHHDIDTDHTQQADECRLAETELGDDESQAEGKPDSHEVTVGPGLSRGAPDQARRGHPGQKRQRGANGLEPHRRAAAHEQKAGHGYEQSAQPKQQADAQHCRRYQGIEPEAQQIQYHVHQQASPDLAVARLSRRGFVLDFKQTRKSELIPRPLQQTIECSGGVG